MTTPSERSQALADILEQRVLVLDGAIGTMLQQRNLTAADFGGPVLDPTGKPMPGRVLKQADYLKVVTTHLRPGYLQKNGVPYSGNATMEEYFDVFKDPYQGNTWMTVTTVVNDPQYLVEPLITHVHFKKIPDNSGWDPTQCRTDEAR